MPSSEVPDASQPEPSVSQETPIRAEEQSSTPLSSSSVDAPPSPRRSPLAPPSPPAPPSSILSSGGDAGPPSSIQLSSGETSPVRPSEDSVGSTPAPKRSTRKPSRRPHGG